MGILLTIEWACVRHTAEPTQMRTMKSCAKLHHVLAKQKAQKQVPLAINERKKGIKPRIWGGNSAYTELSFSVDGVHKAQRDWSDPETLTEANHSTENKVSYLQRERHKCCMITSALKSIYHYHSKSLIHSKAKTVWDASVFYKIYFFLQNE